MIAICVNDMNLIETLEELSKIVEYLKKEFEVQDLSKTKFCLDLELEHKVDEIFVNNISLYRKDT